MSKKKLTNKEITSAMEGLSRNDHMLYKEIIEMKQAFALYLDYRKESFKEDSEGFNDFVKAKTEEFENQQRSKIKE